MSDWVNVRWTQARQVVELTDPRAARALADTVTPAGYFAGLRSEDRFEEAVAFLALALPRLDGVSWAAQTLAATAEPAGAEEAAARDAIRAWIAEPTDQLRRRAWTVGGEAPDWSPERLLAHAAFLSGGSISPVDLPAVNPETDLSGRMVAATIISAAYATADPDAVLQKALDAGDLIARGKRP